MKDTEFYKLIDRYLKDQVKPEEKQKLEDWLNHLAENEASEKLSVKEASDTGEKIYQQLTEQIKATEKPERGLIISLKPLLKIASCIALFGLLIIGFRVQLKELFNIGQYISVVNANGHITKSILADGTIIWLKGNSRLHYPVKFKGGLRKVDLEGEALFEVAKDAAHPFIIRCGALTTRVLGTSFNIRQNKNETEVAVLTGRVFLSYKNVAAVTLQPYQKGLYYEQKKTLVKEAQPAIQTADFTKGTEYNMLFNDAQLTEVVRRVEKKFEVAITIKDERLGKSLLTADLTDQSLTNTLNLISGALNLDYTIDNKDIVLQKLTK